MEAREIKKLYYSISEVSDITELKQYVLRYWETEFPTIKPDKNRAGNRIYKEKDIENFKIIQTLLHEKKFTIKGARKYLIDQKKNSTIKQNIKPQVSSNSNLIEVKTIKKIKNGLTDILNTIQKYK